MKSLREEILEADPNLDEDEIRDIEEHILRETSRDDVGVREVV